VLPLRNGNILALSREVREIDNYPTSANDPLAPRELAPVRGDRIVEFDRTGQIVKDISLLDLLDPRRPTHGSTMGTGTGTSRDWSHSNALSYDEASDCYLVSLRHQDAVVKISRADGTLKWILGNHENWGAQWQPYLLTQVGEPFEWQFAQHAAEFTASGVGLYDNGTWRAPAFQDWTEQYSRALRFNVDDEARTISLAYAYGTPPSDNPFFSPQLSDADFLEQTRNTLITASTLNDEQYPSIYYSRIMEVTATNEVVFDVIVRDDPGPKPTAHKTFGSERIADLRGLLAQ
jgi:hypothetical protein